MSANKGLKDFFIPSESNNFRARLLHLPFLAAFLFFFLFFKTALSLYLLANPAVLGYSSQITSAQVVELTNEERKKYGLSALTVNPLLEEAARRKAEDMFANDYWSHRSPAGKTPWDFLKEVDYSYVYAGENLARDFADASAVVAAWMASPSHKENIVGKNYQEIGVAVVDGELGGLKTTLVVQMFGTPAKLVSPKPQAPVKEIPQETILKTEESGVVLPSAERNNNLGEKEGTINLLSLEKLAVVFFLGLLLGVLTVDKLVAEKRQAPRLTADNNAHLIFLLFIILVVALLEAGTIV
ncbi:hypothetical protein KBI33_00785 [Candidatus Shapirobacteria bacterium]|nr:hypothetical protein [Candidatus Shapirobacteria bacterium]